jgi:exosortase E/protease (VPEID-CTERM system)
VPSDSSMPLVENAINRPSSKPLSLGLVQRLALFALLFAVEWIPVSMHFRFQRGAGVILQVSVVAVSLLLAISFVRFKESFARVSEELRTTGINWALLGAHTAAFLAFLGLSLISVDLHGIAGLVITALWFATGAAAVGLSATALIPGAVIVRLARSTGYIWIFTLAAGLVARWMVTYSTFGKSAVWNPAFDLSWKPATDFTFRLVEILLSFLLHEVVADRATMIIGSPTFQVQILPWCAGFEGTALMLVFSVAWLGFFRREYRFPQALLLIPAGMIVMWVSNAVRIAALIMIGVAGAPDIAEGGFHSQAGWIAFTSVALAFTVLSRRISWMSTTTRAVPLAAPATYNPSAAYLLPFLAILGVGMISSAASGAFEWLYPLRFLAAVVVLWHFRASYRHLDWSFSWLSLVAGTVIFGIWLGMDRFGAPPSDIAMGSALASLPGPGRIAWIVARAAAAVITVPIAEELAFRGFLIRRLISADFEALDLRRYTWLSLLVSSIAFGLLHGRQWFAGVLAGLVFAAVMLRKGKIGDAVVAHATTNAWLALWVLQGGRWHFW